MATKKKPSAAQLRARAQFVARFGGGKAKKKAPARRKKNPVGRSRSRTPIIPAKVAETARIWRIKNPIGKPGRSGKDISRNILEADFGRQTRDLSGRRANPTHQPVRFCVYEARHGIAGKLLGAFPDMKLAKEYAQAWAHKNKCPAGIIGKAH